MVKWDDSVDAKIARALRIQCDAIPKDDFMPGCTNNPAWVVSAKGGPRLHACLNEMHLGSVVADCWRASDRKVRVQRLS